MEPNNFIKARCHYFMIITTLACDDAIQEGIVNKRNVTPLLFFFGKAWMNIKIQKWVLPEGSETLKEKRLLALVGFLLDKGIVFDGACYKMTIARMLMKTNTLDGIGNQMTIVNYLKPKLPPEVRANAELLYEEFWKSSSNIGQ